MTEHTNTDQANTILLSARRAGFTLGLTPAGQLTVSPASQITPERQALLLRHHDALVALLRAEQEAPAPDPFEDWKALVRSL